MLKDTTETTEILKVLDDIATLEPGKYAQLAAKKISEKYKKIREATARKNRYKLPGEIVRIEKVETDQGEVKVPISNEKPKRSGKEAAKKIIKKYDNIRREKTFRKIVDANEKKKKTENINIIEDIKNSAAKKSTRITAKKILQKYKSMKRPKKTYLLNEEDLDSIEYNEPQEDLFRGESIVEAANKVLDFEKFKKDQANTLKKMNSKSKKSTKIAAKNISQKYKNLKKPKKTFLVNEEDLEKIAYDEPEEEDLFRGESILEAANKVLDFEEFKKQQEDAINNFNENLLNKNKRKAIEKEEQLIQIIKVPKKRKQQKEKAAQIAAKKISKKYENNSFR